MIILIICNVIGIIYFVPICLSASAKVETSNLLQHYKLWTATHDTVSTELNLYQGKDREIASILQSALAANGAGHACICMHHLALSAEYGSRRACMVHGILMLNPELKGTSTSTHKWRQWSVSCQKNPIERTRYQSIYLDWDDFQTNEKHWIRFNGIEAACMQLALEEMDGKVQCSEVHTNPN
jgi:peptide deformylase